MYSSRTQKMLNMIGTHKTNAQNASPSNISPLKDSNGSQSSQVDNESTKPTVRDDSYLMNCHNLEPDASLLPLETSSIRNSTFWNTVSVADIKSWLQNDLQIVESDELTLHADIFSDALTENQTADNSVMRSTMQQKLPKEMPYIQKEIAHPRKLNIPEVQVEAIKSPGTSSKTSEEIPSTQDENSMPSTSNSNQREIRERKVLTNVSNLLVNSADISSSESDPFGDDDDDLDPDFKISDSVSKEKRKLSLRETLSDSSVSPSGQKGERRSRKRLAKKENWTRNKIKALRNSGQAYKDWKGHERPERKIKESCKGCRLNCNEKITHEDRGIIFKAFWELKDINRQRDYISKYVECIRKARTRKRKTKDQDEDVDENTRRTFTYIYYLPKETKKIQVCKTFFLNTLSISAQTVRTVFNKMSSAGYVMEDRRGKACKNSQLDQSVKQSVRDHINMFQTIDSHYCRQTTSRKYLPSTLNISKMFTLYEEYCLENNIAKRATEGMYRHIFTTEFNMSFYVPKKDLCDTCHKYDSSNPEEKLLVEEEYRQHIENKNLARNLKNAAKERANEQASLCSAVFDLQQILPVPKTEIGLAYYKLKLSTYNFTVFNLASKQAYCYMWYENIGKRGSSEIGSCLLLFIEHQIQNGVTEFSFFSDNCSGQNRNKFLFSLYNYISQKYKIKIQHTYLERGHTQSEGDSVHSVIEKAGRNVAVYLPHQWYSIVRTAKKKNPYVVIEIGQENIFDLKSLQKQTSLNWEKDDQNDKVYWNQIKIVQTLPEHPNIIFYKDSYNADIPFKKIKIFQKGRKSINVNVKDIQLQPLYNGLLHLRKKKFEHLMFLCDKKVILSQYHTFFKNLPYEENNRASESDDD